MDTCLASWKSIFISQIPLTDTNKDIPPARVKKNTVENIKELDEFINKFNLEVKLGEISINHLKTNWKKNKSLNDCFRIISAKLYQIYLDFSPYKNPDASTVKESLDFIHFLFENEKLDQTNKTMLAKLLRPPINCIVSQMNNFTSKSIENPQILFTDVLRALDKAIQYSMDDFDTNISFKTDLINLQTFVFKLFSYSDQNNRKDYYNVLKCFLSNVLANFDKISQANLGLLIETIQFVPEDINYVYDSIYILFEIIKKTKTNKIPKFWEIILFVIQNLIQRIDIPEDIYDKEHEINEFLPGLESKIKLTEETEKIELIDMKQEQIFTPRCKNNKRINDLMNNISEIISLDQKTNIFHVFKFYLDYSKDFQQNLIDSFYISEVLLFSIQKLTITTEYLQEFLKTRFFSDKFSEIIFDDKNNEFFNYFIELRNEYFKYFAQKLTPHEVSTIITEFSGKCIFNYFQCVPFVIHSINNMPNNTIYYSDFLDMTSDYFSESRLIKFSEKSVRWINNSYIYLISFIKYMIDIYPVLLTGKSLDSILELLFESNTQEISINIINTCAETSYVLKLLQLIQQVGDGNLNLVPILIILLEKVKFNDQIAMKLQDILKELANTIVSYPLKDLITSVLGFVSKNCRNSEFIPKFINSIHDSIKKIEIDDKIIEYLEIICFGQKIISSSQNPAILSNPAILPNIINILYNSEKLAEIFGFLLFCCQKSYRNTFTICFHSNIEKQLLDIINQEAVSEIDEERQHNAASFLRGLLYNNVSTETFLGLMKTMRETKNDDLRQRIIGLLTNTADYQALDIMGWMPGFLSLYGENAITVDLDLKKHPFSFVIKFIFDDVYRDEKPTKTLFVDENRCFALMVENGILKCQVEKSDKISVCNFEIKSAVFCSIAFSVSEKQVLFTVCQIENESIFTLSLDKKINLSKQIFIGKYENSENIDHFPINISSIQILQGKRTEEQLMQYCRQKPSDINVNNGIEYLSLNAVNWSVSNSEKFSTPDTIKSSKLWSMTGYLITSYQIQSFYQAIHECGGLSIFLSFFDSIKTDEYFRSLIIIIASLLRDPILAQGFFREKPFLIMKQYLLTYPSKLFCDNMLVSLNYLYNSIYDEEAKFQLFKNIYVNPDIWAKIENDNLRLNFLQKVTDISHKSNFLSRIDLISKYINYLEKEYQKVTEKTEIINEIFTLIEEMSIDNFTQSDQDFILSEVIKFRKDLPLFSQGLLEFLFEFHTKYPQHNKLLTETENYYHPFILLLEDDLTENLTNNFYFLSSFVKFISAIQYKFQCTKSNIKNAVLAAVLKMNWNFVNYPDKSEVTTLIKEISKENDKLLADYFPLICHLAISMSSDDFDEIISFYSQKYEIILREQIEWMFWITYLLLNRHQPEVSDKIISLISIYYVKIPKETPIVQTNIISAIHLIISYLTPFMDGNIIGQTDSTHVSTDGYPLLKFFKGCLHYQSPNVDAILDLMALALFEGPLKENHFAVIPTDCKPLEISFDVVEIDKRDFNLELPLFNEHLDLEDILYIIYEIWPESKGKYNRALSYLAGFYIVDIDDVAKLIKLIQFLSTKVELHKKSFSLGLLKRTQYEKNKNNSSELRKRLSDLVFDINVYASQIMIDFKKKYNFENSDFPPDKDFKEMFEEHSFIKDIRQHLDVIYQSEQLNTNVLFKSVIDALNSLPTINFNSNISEIKEIISIEKLLDFEKFRKYEKKMLSNDCHVYKVKPRIDQNFDITSPRIKIERQLILIPEIELNINSKFQKSVNNVIDSFITFCKEKFVIIYQKSNKSYIIHRFSPLKIINPSENRYIFLTNKQRFYDITITGNVTQEFTQKLNVEIYDENKYLEKYKNGEISANQYYLITNFYKGFTIRTNESNCPKYSEERGFEESNISDEINLINQMKHSVKSIKISPLKITKLSKFVDKQKIDLSSTYSHRKPIKTQSSFSVFENCSVEWIPGKIITPKLMESKICLDFCYNEVLGLIAVLDNHEQVTIYDSWGDKVGEFQVPPTAKQVLFCASLKAFVLLYERGIMLYKLSGCVFGNVSDNSIKYIEVYDRNDSSSPLVFAITENFVYWAEISELEGANDLSKFQKQGLNFQFEKVNFAANDANITFTFTIPNSTYMQLPFSVQITTQEMNSDQNEN